jgi:hypothetical protein
MLAFCLILFTPAIVAILIAGVMDIASFGNSRF